MIKKFLYALISACLFLGQLSAAHFEPAAPESQGVSSQAILKFVNAAEAQVDALHSFMLVRHDKLIAQGWWAPYKSDSPHMLYSLSKSFTSTAVGLAIAEGRLSLNDTVISFFPDETPDEPSTNLKAMRIRDLLAMNSGHEKDTTGRITGVQDKTWVEAFLSLPVEHKPGTHFVYNSGATFMLSAILQKVTGQTVLDYLTPRLFEPLGIEGAAWEQNPQGINMGGWGLKIKTEDIAKLGLLYLHKGVWNGQRILSEEWVAAARSRQTSNGSNPNSDWEQGYGYQFWRCRHNIYRGDGAFGQYCIIMPEQNAVLAITSGLGDMQTPLNLVWDILLPAMQDSPLPQNAEVQQQLEDKLASLQLKTVPGEASSNLAKKLSGSTFQFEPNDRGMQSVSFDFGNKASTITVTSDQGERVIACGYESWVPGRMPFMSAQPEPVAACGAWIEPNVYRVKLAATETPYIQQLDFRFDKDSVMFNLEFNVFFGERKWKAIKGRLEK